MRKKRTSTDAIRLSSESRIRTLKNRTQALSASGNLYNQLIKKKKDDWTSSREEFFGTDRGKKIQDISSQYGIRGQFAEQGKGGVIEGGLEGFLTKNNPNLGKGLGIVREGQDMLKKEQDTMAWMNKSGYKSGHHEERTRTKYTHKLEKRGGAWGLVSWFMRQVATGTEKYQHWVDTTESSRYQQGQRVKQAEEGVKKLEGSRTGLGKSFGELVADINQYKSATGSQSYKDYMKLGTAYEKEMGGLESSRKSIEEGYTTALAQIKGQQDFLKRYSSSMSAYSAGGKDPKQMSDRELRKEEKKRGQIGQGYA